MTLPALPLLASPATTQTGSDPPAYVGTEACLECHVLEELGGGRNVHLRIESFEVQGGAVGCEGCHGAGGAHVEDGEATSLQTFAVDDEAASASCMECHRSKHVSAWPASLHAAEGVGCVTCHAVHAEAEPEATCNQCHAEAVTQFRLPSHHPLREGKMACASCHDVHSATEFMLANRQRGNDLCFECHQDKEGPFIFEHAPVQEDCSICHVPHGSVANNLLRANEPMLCLQCHDFHFHAGYRSADAAEVDVGGIERDNPMGARGFNIAFTTSCTDCHSRVHGSDTPSQTISGQGKGLIQ